MYSYEKRKAAVDLYFKYQNYFAVITELGYPSRGMLRAWINEFKENKELHKKQTRRSKYNEKQKQDAAKHYLEHGRCISRTLRALGYTSRHYLKSWLTECAVGHLGSDPLKFL
jgi:transposase-like protein